MPTRSGLLFTILIFVGCSSASSGAPEAPDGGGPDDAGTSRTISGKYAPPDNRAYLGVSSPGNAMDAFDQAAGILTHPAIFNRYTSLNGDFASNFSSTNTRPGMTPMISWNIDMRGQSVIDGSRDSYILAQAAEVQSWGKPVFIRLAWEMNATWYPQYDLSGGTTTQDYIASWCHVVKLFENVSNAAFVWCPNVGRPNASKTPASAWYPGDDVVDWIALDAYPEYGGGPMGDYLSESDGMDDFAAMAEAHRKPLMLAEWARGNQQKFVPDTAAVFNFVFDWAEKYPNIVKALVYFDYPGATEHPLETHPIGAAAFRQRTVGNPRYILDLVK